MALTTQRPNKFLLDPTPGMVEGHWSLTDNDHLLRAFEYSFNRSSVPLDPNGEWRQSFDLVFCGPQRFEKLHWVYLGWMELARTTQSDGTSRLSSVEEHILGPDINLEWQHIEREVHCLTDSLSTIPPERTWRSRFHTLGQPDPRSRQFSRTCEYLVIREIDGARFYDRKAGNLSPSRKPLPANLPATTTLGVIDACHRSLEKTIEFPRFGIFKNSNAWFEDQMLKRLAANRLHVNEEEMTLRGFVHTGRGHLPAFYWFDEYNRMVAMRQGILAAIANENPVLKGRCPHEA